MKKTLLFIALLCAFAQGIKAQANWEEVYALTQTTSSDWTLIDSGSTTGRTLGSAGNTTYYYLTGNFDFTNSNAGGSGLIILGTVYLYVPQSITITCTGANANGTTGAGAGIELASGNTLVLLGGGTVNATGGNAENGRNGGNGAHSNFWYNHNCQPGSGGNGGNGGGGAGAGIGTRGGNGGTGGSGATANTGATEGTNLGVDGNAGSAGGTAGSMGTLYVIQSSLTLNATGGSKGTSGSGGARGYNAAEDPYNHYAASGGGGGGAGGFGGAANNIGTGGPGGGGGGGGAAGNSTWRANATNGFYRVGAGGGNGGYNGDGTQAANGISSTLTNPYNAEYKEGLSGSYDDDGWEDGNGMHSGGNGGARGNASTSGSAISLAPWPTQGAGTAESPSIIGSATDWNNFAHNVNNHQNYNGKYVKLTSDISVSEMVGISENDSFQGIFLGDGTHTLTFTRGSAASPFDEQNSAPFRYVKDATIRDLKVAGDIYTSQKFSAGLVARSYGTTNINNCHVSTIIHSSVGGDGTHGGMVAMPSGTLNIVDCIYDGKLLTTNSTTCCGGFVGWHNSTSISITNALYIPDFSITMSTEEDVITNGATFVRGSNNGLNGCYYTETMGEAQGTRVYTTAPDDEVTKVVQLFDGNDYYTACIVNNVERYYQYTGSVINIVPTVTDSDDTTLIEGTDYTYAIAPATVQAIGDYTLTITAQGSYGGSKNVLFTVTNKMPITSSSTTLTTGGYKVYNNVTISERINISGNVVLNLGEGAKLTAPKGIELSEGNSLTINGPGELFIERIDHGTQDWGKSGIGASRVGTLVINGGTITAKASTAAAGIGGDRENTSGGSITINGGVVFIQGGPTGSGIGAGLEGRCGDIVINGGQVTVEGGYMGAGIGPGYINSGIINSGTLTLGWTNPDDFIYVIGGLEYAGGDAASSFANNSGSTLNSISFAPDKQFLLDGTQTIATLDNIEAKKLVPYITEPSGVGTVDSPFIISSENDWNIFAYRVSTGTNYIGQYVKLTNDISVKTMAGTNDANSFQGTFDGDGNKLTFNKGTAQSPFNENYCAPFRHVKNAVIKNLHVDGIIYTSEQNAAGIVGESHGALNITNCRSSININSSKPGDGTHGGFVATLSGSNNIILIEGCVFDGSFATIANTTNCGGFVGWPVWNRPTITNSIMKPNSVDAGMLINTFARWHTTYKPTITNCFYVATTNMPTNQGAETVTDAEILPVGDPVAYNVSGITAYTNGISYGGNFYYNPDRNIKRTIAGYGDGDGKWAFIASPVEESILPTEVNNLIGAQIQTTPSVLYNYDLFRLNPGESQWENYVAHTEGFNIVNGQGYLYATKTTKNLVFSGIFNTDDSKTVVLSEGFNLVGNPFVVNAYVSKPFYQMNDTGTDIEPIDNYESYSPVAIPPCTGIVVRASGTDEVTFSTEMPSQSTGNNGNLQMTLTKTGARSDAFQDKAIVSFNQGSQLEKFVFNERHAKLYIPQYGEDYAIAFSDMSGEVPLNFKANEIGRYTIGFNFENVKGVRIQLIDKIEDRITDLKAIDSYTFMGSSIDRSDRFTLVFTQVETDGIFAYQSGNDIIVSGEGELQVFDVMGRMVMSQYINGVQTVEKPSTTGVYIFRLNGMSQKIVVK